MSCELRYTSKPKPQLCAATLFTCISYSVCLLNNKSRIMMISIPRSSYIAIVTEAYKYHSRSELEKSDIRNPNCKSPKFELQKSDIRNPTCKSPRSEIRLVKKYKIRVVYQLRYAISKQINVCKWREITAFWA